MGQIFQAEPIALFESGLTDFMLLPVVSLAQTNHPAVRGLQSGAAVGATADVSAFYRSLSTAGDRTSMLPDPSPVTGAASGTPFFWLWRKPGREAQFRHLLFV